MMAAFQIVALGYAVVIIATAVFYLFTRSMSDGTSYTLLGQDITRAEHDHLKGGQR